MKRRLSLSVLALVFSFIVNANFNDADISLSASAEKVLTFKFEAQPGGTLIKMTDANNQVIYIEEIDALLSYSKKFDLSKLETGEFYISVESELKDIVYTILLSDEQVRIIGKEEVSKPFYRKIEDKLLLNLLNLSKEKVIIKVIDSDNRVIYQDTVEDKLIVEKVFNFEASFNDTYTVIVKNAYDTYYKNFKVN